MREEGERDGGIKLLFGGLCDLGSQDSKESEDRKFARFAIEEARKSVAENDGRPHPLVGAIVVKNGEVLAFAYRGEGKGDHAEYIALEKRLPDAAVAGSTLYTTLEPCTTRNHPKIPCVDRVIERKVRRVVIGMLDPDPRITGRGQRKLRKANIITDLFPHELMAEVEDLNREFTRAFESTPQHEPVQAVSAYPQVDFEFKPEKIVVGQVLPRPPKLILIVRNRGTTRLKEVKLRTTQYQFDFNAIVPATVTKLPEGKIRIDPGKYELIFNKRMPPAMGHDQILNRSIKGNGGEKRVDLSETKPFRFITPPKPGEPGGAGGPPLNQLAGESADLRFYAIRFTFLETELNRRFSYYKVISCQEPYLLPFDNPSMSIIVDPEGRQAFFRAPIEKILADQRDIFKYHPEEEYIPGGRPSRIAP